MSIKRKFTVEPPLLGLGGQPVRTVTLNIGTNPPGATGASGVPGLPGATGVPGLPGATGVSGNPTMEVTSPDGSVWVITVSNSGVLGTTQVSGPATVDEPPVDEGDGSEPPVDEGDGSGSGGASGGGSGSGGASGGGSDEEDLSLQED